MLCVSLWTCNLMFTDLRQLETKGSSGKRNNLQTSLLLGMVILKGCCLGKAQDSSLPSLKPLLGSYHSYLENKQWAFEPWKPPNYEMLHQRKSAGPRKSVFLSEAVFPPLFPSAGITLVYWFLSGLYWKWNKITNMWQYSELFQLFFLTHQTWLACIVFPIVNWPNVSLLHKKVKLAFQSMMSGP